MINGLRGFDSVFAQNYDPPYFLYPFSKPIGTNQSGLMTFSNYNISVSAAEACRNSDSPFRGDGTDFVLSVNGVLVSDNIEVLLSETVDTGFKHSDHNTVKIEFRLK